MPSYYTIKSYITDNDNDIFYELNSDIWNIIVDEYLFYNISSIVNYQLQIKDTIKHIYTINNNISQYNIILNNCMNSLIIIFNYVLHIVDNKYETDDNDMFFLQNAYNNKVIWNNNNYCSKGNNEIEVVLNKLRYIIDFNKINNIFNICVGNKKYFSWKSTTYEHHKNRRKIFDQFVTLSYNINNLIKK